jgi:hypothetical protein
MSNVSLIKENIIKGTQDYYTAISKEDKEKHKIELQKQFKKFHYYRKSNQEDYKLIKKIIENIT